jgi:hypothetical protein
MTIPVDYGEYTVHPAADLFPLMDDDELRRLANDIKQNGLKNHILVQGNVILDGRNRYRALRLLDETIYTDEYRGNGSVTKMIVSLNLHRRHLNESQRAIVAESLTAVYEAEARERQGTRTDLRAELPESEFGRARDKAAATVNVSPRLVADAATLKREAPPEVIEAIKAGKTTVSAEVKKVRAAKRPQQQPSATRPARGRSWQAPQAIEQLAIAIQQRFPTEDVQKLVCLLTGAGGK